MYKDGVPFGTGEAEERGRSLHFRAECPFLPGIHRLYILEEGKKTLPLGVLMPEGSGLALDRRIDRGSWDTAGADGHIYGVLCEGGAQPVPLSLEKGGEACSTPFAVDRWMETERPESFTEDAVLLGTLRTAKDALYRYVSGSVELAVPADCHGSIAPALLFARFERIRGREYFVLRLSPSGLPRRADAASRY